MLQYNPLKQCVATPSTGVHRVTRGLIASSEFKVTLETRLAILRQLLVMSSLLLGNISAGYGAEFLDIFFLGSSCVELRDNSSSLCVTLGIAVTVDTILDEDTLLIIHLTKEDFDVLWRHELRFEDLEPPECKDSWGHHEDFLRGLQLARFPSGTCVYFAEVGFSDFPLQPGVRYTLELDPHDHHLETFDRESGNRMSLMLAVKSDPIRLKDDRHLASGRQLDF